MDTWNSLEVAKLAVSILTPLLVLLLGLLVARLGRRIEDAQWANRKLVERRLDLYDQMAPLLNDLYCFFFCVGDFAKVSPPKAVEIKRTLDKAFYVNRFLMSDEFAAKYLVFVRTCFKEWTGYAEHAKLRTAIGRQRAERTDWEDHWGESCFVLDEAEQRTNADIGAAYDALMTVFSSQVGVRT